MINRNLQQGFSQQVVALLPWREKAGTAQMRVHRKGHCRGFLSAISAIFKNETGEDPRVLRTAIPGMSVLCNTPPSARCATSPAGGEGNNKRFPCGFTLMELLVVVLIIGILVAVAVPKYQKALVKTHAMYGLTLIKEIARGMELYYEQHGTYPEKFEALDLELPGDFQSKGGDPYSFDISENNEWKVSIMKEEPGYKGIVTLIYQNGPWKGIGFAYIPRFKGSAEAVRGNSGKVMCIENGYKENPYIGDRFCKPFFNGRDKRRTGAFYWYVVDL